MAGVYHFLPEVTEADLVEAGERRLPNDLVQRFGLAAAFPDGRSVPDDIIAVEREVDEQRGVVLYRKTPKDPPSWGGERCTWAVWDSRYVGIDPKALPTPEDLERKTVYTDYLIDSKWRVPVGRSPSASGEIPWSLVPRPDGSLDRVIATEFTDLFVLAGDILCLFARWEDGDEPNVEQKFFYALKVLQVNYAIDPSIVASLAQFGCSPLVTTTLDMILMFAVDRETTQEWADLAGRIQKKSPSP